MSKKLKGASLMTAAILAISERSFMTSVYNEGHRKSKPSQAEPFPFPAGHSERLFQTFKDMHNVACQFQVAGNTPKATRKAEAKIRAQLINYVKNTSLEDMVRFGQFNIYK